VLIDAHAGFPRWIGSGADFIEIDVRRDQRGVIIDAHDEPQPGARHATLDEILHALDGRAGLHLDMKEPGYEVELLTRVLSALPPQKVVATPDFEESIRVIKAKFPEVRVSPLDFVAVDQRYADRSYDKPLWVWTVDDKRLMRRLMDDPRVECLITNRVDRALKLRSARS